MFVFLEISAGLLCILEFRLHVFVVGFVGHLGQKAAKRVFHQKTAGLRSLALIMENILIYLWETGISTTVVVIITLVTNFHFEFELKI